MITKIAHVGLAVDDLEKGVSFYKGLGFQEIKKFEESDPELKAVFMDKGGMGLEMFEFENISDPKAKFIKNHTGLITDDLESDLNFFKNTGFKVVIPLRKGVTVKRYVFLENTYGNIIELIEM